MLVAREGSQYVSRMADDVSRMADAEHAAASARAVPAGCGTTELRGPLPMPVFPPIYAPDRSAGG